jgi:hypothetical protein
VPLDPYRQLATSCDRLDRRRPDLVARLDLPGVGTTAELLCVARDTRDPEASDRALKALARAGQHDPDAVTLIIGVVAPRLRAWAAPGRSSEFREDLLGELTVVVYDAIARGDLERLDHIADRLRWRAHARVSKRHRRVRWHGEINRTTTDPYDPSRLVTLEAAHGPAPEPDPVGDGVTLQVDLGRFAAACQAAVADGLVPVAAWEAYRDHRLARALAGPGEAVPDVQRKRAERAALRIRWFVDEALEGHAA